MVYDDQLNARVEGETVDEVEAIADRTGLRKSEVVRRLIKLGLQDVNEIGPEVLLGAGAESVEAD